LEGKTVVSSGSGNSYQGGSAIYAHVYYELLLTTKVNLFRVTKYCPPILVGTKRRGKENKLVGLEEDVQI
jgi:hypothetical protein